MIDVRSGEIFQYVLKVPSGKMITNISVNENDLTDSSGKVRIRHEILLGAYWHEFKKISPIKELEMPKTPGQDLTDFLSGKNFIVFIVHKKDF